MSFKPQINLDRLPRHIAIIMDGNGRWAKENGMPRVFGHRSAIKSVQEVAESAAEIGVDYVTLYAFSTENWNRPKFEVNALMELLIQTIRKETKTLLKNNIKLNAIGDLNRLPRKCLKELNEAMSLTAEGHRMTLNLALSYSGRWDVVEAIKSIAADLQNGYITANDIDDDLVDNHLSTQGIPDPELMIRTSGEYRISNFLLWQTAYSEFYFTPKFWPDFRKEDLYEAIVAYQQRERRFGKVSEQLTV